MSDHFFLRLEPQTLNTEEPTVSWLRTRGGEVTPQKQGSLAEAADACSDAHITIIVPGQLCTSIQVSLPGVSRGRLVQAVPYALEEQLIDDVEELHFSLGELNDGHLPVVVVTQHLLEQWLELLEQHNITPQRMIPDYLLVPHPDQGWHLWFDEHGVMLRRSLDCGLCMALAKPILMLQRIYDESAVKPEHLRVSSSVDQPIDGLVAWCEENNIALTQDEAPQSLLQVADHTVRCERIINLLQGAYSNQVKISRQWRPWWPAVAVLAVMAISQLISMGVDHQRLSAEQIALDQSIKQLYLDTFPDARKVVDPRAQMEARLKAQNTSGKGEQFYQLLGGVTLLSDNKVDFELQRLRYQEGALNVDMHLNNLQVLDQIKQLFSEKKGLQAEVVSASARGGKVEARLLIKGSGS